MVDLVHLKTNVNKKRIGSAILLIAIVAVSAVYFLMQTYSSFAVYTAPPPEIPGPYYICSECTIYGPPVNLARIRAIHGGSYSADFSYVKWGYNPFYKVFADNTLQVVFWSDLYTVLNRVSENFAQEADITNTFTNMKAASSIDLESFRGTIYYFGNLPGIMIAGNGGGTLNTITSYLYAFQGRYNYQNTYLNGSLCLSNEGLNATGFPQNYGMWNIGHSWWTLYMKDYQFLTTTVTNYRIYNVTDSPGTGYVTKAIEPSSPRSGAPLNVSVRLDPPTCVNATITDYYPTSFAWRSEPVTLTKYKIGTGQVAMYSLTVVPQVDSNPANMKFTISYNQASTILQSLAGDEYIKMSYNLTSPPLSGEYTLPAAKIDYSIPLP